VKLVERPQDLEAVAKLLAVFPVTAILGPRQCGKTTLARAFNADHSFDLENPRDVARLEQPQLALEDLRGLIVIDEIQRLPDLFPLLRYLVDRGVDQKYLILGSASRDLIRQGSETLAGRIAFYQLGGFRLSDIGAENAATLWLRGGLPPSFLAATDEASLVWRRQYISTFLERDIPQLGIGVPARTLRRFWTMLSHYHGQILNYSELGRSFGVSDMTVRRTSASASYAGRSCSCGTAACCTPSCRWNQENSCRHPPSLALRGRVSPWNASAGSWTARNRSCTSGVPTPVRRSICSGSGAVATGVWNASIGMLPA
jgi:predicted AAA+ superfamily ATPase